MSTEERDGLLELLLAAKDVQEAEMACAIEEGDGVGDSARIEMEEARDEDFGSSRG
jgi:hypothetical protein